MKFQETFRKKKYLDLLLKFRRSFASIGYNISEGSGRNSDKEFANFINIALGSSNEAENQLILAKDLEYIEVALFESLNEELILLKKK